MAVWLVRAVVAIALLVAGAGDCARMVLDSNAGGGSGAPAGGGGGGGAWPPQAQQPTQPQWGQPQWGQPQPPVVPAPVPPPPTTSAGRASGARRLPVSTPDEVSEINRTLDLIEQGGPFPNRQDGTVFGNREGRLPARPYGYYHEYTVRTPGAFTRGARRIIRGASGETYYTSDHYGTFVPLDPTRY